MNNKDAISAFYTLINRLYSINYSATRLSQQRNSHEVARNFRFDRPMDPRSSWVNSKIADIARIREEFFRNYRSSAPTSNENFEIISSECERSKEALRMMHNIWYEKDCSFEEIFDGFVCKQPEFLEFIKIIETTPIVTDDEALVHIANAYSTYISNLFYKTITSSMVDILDQLETEVNEYAVPTFYRGVIQNDGLTTISRDDLAKLRKQVDAKGKIIHSTKVPKKDVAFVTAYNVVAFKHYELDMFLKQLELRLKSANSDVVNTVSNKIVEGTFDFLNGVKKGDKISVDEIYVSRLELSYIAYANQMLDFAMQSFEAHTKTEAKQKS